MRVSTNVLVAGVVSVVTVALAAVTILLLGNKGDSTLVAVIFGFAGTNVTALMALYQAASVRHEIKNGAVKQPVKEAIREVLKEDES